MYSLNPLFQFKKLISYLLIIFCLTACSTSPQVMAEQRLFLDLNLEFLDEYQLSKQTFENIKVGGLSGISYDPKLNHFYAISDDRSQFAPARFYTLKINLDQKESANPKINNITIEKVTLLKDNQGKTYSPGVLDPEGIALSPRHTVFISSEGVTSKSIPAFMREFNLETGTEIDDLRIPQRYLPETENNPETEPKGIQDNLGFEALTLNPNSLAPEDPFRLFTATESALIQDTNLEKPEAEARIRFLHYVINPIGKPIIVAEHLYILDSGADDVLYNGLSELLALPKEGYFLSLERTFGLSGFGAKLYQVTIANATDTSNITSLKGDLNQIVPMRKKLLLDLTSLGINLDNLEGITLGPRLSDGSQSLILVSDDNFSEDQTTQFLLFRLLEK